MKRANSLGAILELLLAAALWGFGFVATKWALEVLDTVELMFLRFALATLIGLPIVFILRSRYSIHKKFRLSFMPAVFLVGTLLFQTWGLVYTTPTKCGFITTLYVVFVPLLEAVLTRKRIKMGIWACVAGALIGTGLIVDIGFSDINIGDVLTLISALLATGQIYWMGGVSPNINQAFVFNIYQIFWSIIMVAPFVPYAKLTSKLHAVSAWPWHAGFGIVSLAFGSTVIAFYLQVRAQKDLSPTVSSLMFLLESPFAMIFSLMLLGQTLTLLESLGALMIFVSAYFATWIEAQSQRKIDFAA
ncbi:MAG: DMT family transporter [Bdellovibrionales bacterium]